MSFLSLTLLHIYQICNHNQLLFLILCQVCLILVNIKIEIVFWALFCHLGLALGSWLATRVFQCQQPD